MTVAQARGEAAAQALISTLTASESVGTTEGVADVTLCILRRERMGAPMRVVKKIQFS